MTGTDVIQQLIQMFNMMLLGSSIMFIFDLTSEIVRQAGWRRLKHMAADFITTMFCGCVFCMLLINHNHGLIRSYVLSGLIVGVAVYRGVLKTFVSQQWSHAFFVRRLRLAHFFVLRRQAYGSV